MSIVPMLSSKHKVSENCFIVVRMYLFYNYNDIIDGNDDD